MIDKAKIALGKWACSVLERYGLKVVLLDHENHDSARLEWWAKHYTQPLTIESCQEALDFGKALAHHNDFRVAIDTVRNKKT